MFIDGSGIPVRQTKDTSVYSDTVKDKNRHKSEVLEL
jgi:hypothetical protein